MKVQLREHAVHVVLHRAELDAELGRDFLVRVTPFQEPRDLALPRRQYSEVVLRRDRARLPSEGADDRSGQLRRAVRILGQDAAEILKKVSVGAIGRDEPDEPGLGEAQEQLGLGTSMDRDRASTGNCLEECLGERHGVRGSKVDENKVGIGRMGTSHGVLT